jgi:hypothetical protein
MQMILPDMVEVLKKRNKETDPEKRKALEEEWLRLAHEHIEELTTEPFTVIS